MAKLTNDTLSEQFVGKPVNMERLHEFSEGNRESFYYINSLQYAEIPKYVELFNITYILKDKWDYDGTDLELVVRVKDGTIATCGIDKSRYSGYGHGRPNTVVYTPTQQEFRIARRILNYITTMD